MAEAGHASTHASAHADTPPPTLDALPAELLSRVVSLCGSPADIARAAAVTRHFSAVAAEGLRLRAQERRYELSEVSVGRQCLEAVRCEADPPLTRVVAGDSHSVFIDGEGRLWSCGREDRYSRGLLGHGKGVAQLKTPARIASRLDGHPAVKLAAGVAHSLAIAADGSIWSWGKGRYGRLGHGDELDQPQPVRIVALAGRHVVAVAAGRSHSLALTADGSVWSWGWGREGRLGHCNSETQLLPKKVEALASHLVISVAAGAYHNLAITADGAAWSWGSFLEWGDSWAIRGPLGSFRQTPPPPKRIEAFIQRIVAVSAGRDHKLAIDSDNAVWSWGKGTSGQLGHGNEQSRQEPQKVESLAGRRVVAVAAGGDHSLALTADGGVWCWGSAGDHCSSKPERVNFFPASSFVVALAAGEAHSLATTADGATWAWGYGGNGCLGQGEDDSDQPVPKRIEVWARSERESCV